MEPSDRLLSIAAKYAPEIRNALYEAYRVFLRRVSSSVIEQALLTKGMQGIVDLAESFGNDVAENVMPKITDAWTESGRMVIGLLPETAVSAGILFDVLPVGAVTAANKYKAALVREISSKTIDAIIQAVEEGIITGVNPRVVARDFRNAVGLTAAQERAVRNYRRYLETLDPEALRRTLRDKRLDRSLMRAIKNKTPLSSERIDYWTERYRQRYLKYRAETISRTESLRAMAMGEYDTLMAAYLQGDVNLNLRRFWVSTMDDRTRDAHIAVPEMNQNGVLVTEPFQTPLGPLLYPRDPNGSAQNVINCRCRVFYRIMKNDGSRPVVPYEAAFPSKYNDALK